MCELNIGIHLPGLFVPAGMRPVYYEDFPAVLHAETFRVQEPDRERAAAQCGERVESIRQCLYARYTCRTKCGSRAYLPVT